MLFCRSAHFYCVLAGCAGCDGAALQYGCTWINTHFMLADEMPHGDMKQRGYGKDMSLYGLEDDTGARRGHGRALTAARGAGS